MRTSSARQLELDFSSSRSLSPGNQFEGENLEPARTAAGSQLTSRATVPDFGLPHNLYAIAARRAGRLNASAISEQERDNLRVERQLLLDKLFKKTINRSEMIRL